MTLQSNREEWMIMGGLRGGRLLARLHPCPMHPCRLLLLALHSDTTRIIMVLLGHEYLALNDPLRGTAQWLQWVVSGPDHLHSHQFRCWATSRTSLTANCVIDWFSVRPGATPTLNPYRPPAYIARHSMTEVDVLLTKHATQVLLLDQDQQMQADRHNQKRSEAPY